jgi:type IV pilus assembly protein PilA
MNKLFRRNRNRKGFTLIELLIVILVLAILMAVALPLYLSAVSDSQLKTCRSNMQTIANAEQAYKTSTPSHVYTTTLANLNPNLGSTPICPSAGAYSVTISTGASTAQNGSTVPAGGLVIACSATGHGVFAPGIDSE